MEQGNLNQNEQGRSMVEMLGVLAVVGLLSVMAFAGFRIALNKAKANAIVHDGRMVWMEALANQQPIPDWTVSTMANESGKQFYAKRDIKDNNYVKVTAVEEEICQQILGLQKDGELIVLTETLRPFTECQETSDLIFGFDGVGRLIPCAASADCQEEGADPYNGYCDTEEGYCHECGALELLNGDETACTCDTSKAVNCSDGEGNSWCCGDDTGASNLICGGSAGSCVPNPDGKCWYDFAVTNGENRSLCHYTLKINGDEYDLTAEEGKGCASDEYCYFAYRNSNCEGVSSDTTELYGRCQKQGDMLLDLTCQGDVYYTLSEGAGCPVGKYCYIKWVNGRCNNQATTQTGTLYGTCIAQDDENDVVCPY